jgi:hypothetical protein
LQTSEVAAIKESEPNKVLTPEEIMKEQERRRRLGGANDSVVSF